MGPNLLADLFTVSFWFGAAASVLSFVFGVGRHGGTVVPHAGDLASHGSVGPHAQLGADISPLNLSSLLAFLVVFGAVGLLLPSGIGAILALILAGFAGTFAGWLAFLFIARFLVRGQTLLHDDPIVGTLAKVSLPIASLHTGEVIYTRHGVRRSDGARSADDEPIEAGEEVVIVGYQNGIATVQRWRDYIT